MVVVIYALAWLLLVTAAGILYITGNFNQLALTASGFLFSTLFFTGIVAVLPWWMDKKHRLKLFSAANLRAAAAAASGLPTRPIENRRMRNNARQATHRKIHTFVPPDYLPGLRRISLDAGRQLQRRKITQPAQVSR